MARTLAGDEEAFASIYDEFATPIYDFCRSILRDDADAADAAQETFVVAHQKLDTLRDPQKLRPWLYSIARRQSLRRVDQRRRTVAGDELGEMSDETIDLDAGLSEQDAVKLVWDAATGLSPRDRLVLDLHLRHGLAGQDLADSLDVTRQNAYVLLDKMKSALSRAAGALLVARYKRRDCDELEALLADWDGRYSPLVRKRVARHVDSCDVCERNKGALIAPDRLFSLAPLVAAPAALRAGVLEAIGNGADSGGRAGARWSFSSARRSTRRQHLSPVDSGEGRCGCHLVHRFARWRCVGSGRWHRQPCSAGTDGHRRAHYRTNHPGAIRLDHHCSRCHVIDDDDHHQRRPD